MLAVSPELINSTEINANAFMTLSKLAFSSLERLATLNLNATRLALEEGTSGVAAMLKGKDARKQQKLLDASAGTATNNVAAYLQGVQEIASETQNEVSKLISSYFSAPGGSANPSEGCLKGFDLFKNFAQQVTDMTAANTRMVGDATARISKSAASLVKKDT